MLIAVVVQVTARLEQFDCKQNGWVLEGFPQTLAQCEALKTASFEPVKVVQLRVSEAALVCSSQY